MAVRPQAFVVTCKNCRWTRLSRPKSDVLTHQELPKVCPQCRSDELVMSRPNLIDRVIGLMFS